MQRRRVVVTGLGAISPLGLNVEQTWQGIVAGKSGVVRREDLREQDFPVQISGLVPNYTPSEYFSPKDARKMDQFTQFAMIASEEAVKDAGLEVSEANADRIGVAVGAGIGGIDTITKNYDKFLAGGARKVSPFFIPASIINMASGQISIKFGMKGPNIAIVTACTTGTHNIGSAARMIAYGDADVMLAGGAEMGSTPLCIAGFAACKALSSRNDDPEAASRPWDKDRDGFVLGEGAGVLVLEEYEHAKRRGAKMYAELTGYALNADAFHITAPDETGDGHYRVMTAALKDAGLDPQQVDYINAHGTSTPAGDVIEAKAIQRTFGDHASQLAVSSTKSMIGHLLGAAGAVEAIFSILAIRDNIAPPTINLDNPEEGCHLNFVPGEAQERDINIALSNSFGFGGTNGSLIFSRL